MSMIKRLMEEREAQESYARGIAIEARVLKRCEVHEDQVWDVGGDHSSAFKLGNWKFTNGKLPEGLYSDRKELMDAIQRAIDNSGMECGICGKYRGD